ncbi:MAG TPA: tetratricopeptide repeat protein, partial [Candidatus Nitrosocosmicus sp.]
MSADKDDISRNTTNKDIATNQNNSTTKYNISIEKNHLDSLDPKFKNSFEEFIRVLNGHLDDAQVSKNQKKLLEKQIEGLALEIKNIPFYKKIQDNPKTDFTQSINKNKDIDMECCNKALEINPQNADAYYNKAQALSTIEKYAEAIEYYDKALEINPQNADICYNNKGLSLYYLGNNDEAIECYDKALEINPQNADAYYNKAQALSTIEKYAEAIECYDKALEINPQNADAYYNKAQALSTI